MTITSFLADKTVNEILAAYNKVAPNELTSWKGKKSDLIEKVVANPANVITPNMLAAKFNTTARQVRKVLRLHRHAAFKKSRHYNTPADLMVIFGIINLDQA